MVNKLIYTICVIHSKCLREIIFCNLCQPQIIRIFPRRPNRKIGQNTFFDLECSQMIYSAAFPLIELLQVRSRRQMIWQIEGRGNEDKSYFSEMLFIIQTFIFNF